ncbi:MAG: sulfatase-like hydrolase/transferase [Caldilineaceae bacterium]
MGFSGNPSSRLHNYITFPGWGSYEEDAAPRHRTSTMWRSPSWIGWRKSGIRSSSSCDTWTHTPYLPPYPYERAFYHGDELDPENKSMEPVMNFAPFRDFFATWMPPGITDKDYVIAQYDGAIAYMDAAIRSIFTALEARGLAENTIVVVNGDHGETLYDHECWFDHHGMYEPTLVVPLIIRYPGKMPAGKRCARLQSAQGPRPHAAGVGRVTAR